MKKFNDRVSILGIGVSAINYSLGLNFIKNTILKNETTYICVTAVHLIMECQQSSNLATGVNSAGLVTPDGMPLVWLLRLYGKKHASRVYGPIFMEKICAMAEKNGWLVYLVGGREGQSSAVKQKIGSMNPGLRIVGNEDTPVRPIPKRQNKQLIQRINASGAKIVFVALGCPNQERWMIENRKKLRASVLIGVGAAFDFIIGKAKQAPEWIQNSGFEWVYRFLHDPIRLFRRYMILNSIFCFQLAKQFYSDFILGRKTHS